MSRTIIVPKSIIVKEEIGSLGMVDIFIVVGAFLIGLITSPIVYSFLFIPYVLFVPGVTFYMLLPNGDLHKKKNYEAYFIIMLRDSHIYHSS